MKASELITRLQELVEEHGDGEVSIDTYDGIAVDIYSVHMTELVDKQGAKVGKCFSVSTSQDLEIHEPTEQEIDEELRELRNESQERNRRKDNH